MPRFIIKILTSLILLIIPFTGFSTTFTAVANGDWNTPATWGETVLVPTINDDVFIDGFQVSVTTDASAFYVMLTNATGTDSTSLDVKGSNITLSIANDLFLVAENQPQSIQLNISGSALIDIDGKLYIDRLSDNLQNNGLQLKIFEQGQLSIFKTMTYDYQSGGAGESFDEILLLDQAYLEVISSTFIEHDIGGEFSMSVSQDAEINNLNKINFGQSGTQPMTINFSDASKVSTTNSIKFTNYGGGSSLVVNVINGANISTSGDMTFTSSTSNSKVFANIDGNDSTLDANTNLILEAESDSDVKITLSNQANLAVAGAIQRNSVNKFGSIQMDDTASLTFDGSSQQSIPRNKYPDSGTDSIQLGTLNLQNALNESFILEGDLIVDHHLSLSNGILITHDTALLIIGNGASISLGNSNAYVDGPMVKKGITADSSFTFPVGNNGTYAAISIDSISVSTVEYTAKYIGCPPPLGVKSEPLKGVNTSGYWEIDRNDSNPVGDITLHWDDASAVGIDQLSSLVVASYEISTGWMSIGQTDQTGGVGAGVEGSIKNAIGCPPPLGVRTFAFGSEDENENVLLPVEMNSFKAYKNNTNSKIFLEWETSSEINSDYFSIEKSYDGVTFREIDQVQSTGNSTSLQFYSSIDINPRNGNNYFRIKQVDIDGMMEFSVLLNVFIHEKDNKPIIYPNPVKNHLNLYSKALNHDDEVWINVYDLTGTCVYSTSENSQDGQISLSTSTMNLKEAGIYFINYRHHKINYSIEFVKVND